MEENMIQTQKRKVKVSRLVVIAGFIVLILALVFGLYKVFASNPYAKYDEYNTETKQAGSREHTSEKTDQYYVSVHYPTYGIKELDEVVSSYRDKKLMKSEKMEGQYFVSVDYDSKEIFEQYIQLTIHQKVYKPDGNLMKTESTSYNYDKKQKKLLQVDDVLRRDYVDYVKTSAKENNLDASKINTKSLTNFIIDEKNVTFYVDNDVTKKFAVTYADKKELIKLNNKSIPSYYQGDVIQPAEEKVDPNKKMIAITFDDGPHHQNTEVIMKEFEKHGGKATFFMLGKNVKDEKTGVDQTAIVKDMYKRGFEVGNHSWDHSMAIAANQKNFMNKEEVKAEIFNTQDAIYQAIGDEPNYFRPPYGAINKNVREVSSIDFALWDVDTQDWSNKNANAITNIIKRDIHDGAVILLHDIHDFSTESVKQFLPILKEQGYQFVTLSTLMKYKGEDLMKDNIMIAADMNK